MRRSSSTQYQSRSSSTQYQSLWNSNSKPIDNGNRLLAHAGYSYESS